MHIQIVYHTIIASSCSQLSDYNSYLFRETADVVRIDGFYSYVRKHEPKDTGKELLVYKEYPSSRLHCMTIPASTGAYIYQLHVCVHTVYILCLVSRISRVDGHSRN